jgi:hypothetical protein
MEHSKNERGNVCLPEEIFSFLIKSEKVRDLMVDGDCKSF